MQNDTFPTFWRLPRVCVETGLSRASVYRLIAEGTFPLPAKIGSRASAWVAAEVQDWAQGRIAARDAKASA